MGDDRHDSGHHLAGIDRILCRRCPNRLAAWWHIWHCDRHDGHVMTAAYILAMDTFGPINRQCGRYSRMSHAPAGTREITDNLDAVGNTTKALTKGYAIGSAALAAFLLFSAYLDKVTEVMHVRGLLEAGERFDVVNLANVNTFVGALLGAMLVFLFSSLAIRAVGRAGSDNIEEVRRQFRENPGIMEGTVKPDLCSLC